MSVNYDEIARDLYALGSWTMMGLLIAVLAILRNTSLILEVIIALGIGFIISSMFNPDDRIVRLIIGLTAVALLGGTLRWMIIAAIIGIAAVTMSKRYLETKDVWRSAIVGVLVQGLALFFSSFI